jgi:myo-inositol-1(or 4)-monophosphatase
VDGESLLPVLREVTSAVRRRLESLEDWGLAGGRAGQHRSDLAADEAALEVLQRERLAVLSEESGWHAGSATGSSDATGVLVVVDPVDGSTNASRHLPWWGTSVCAVNAEGLLAAVVVNQATGWQWEAWRDGGAWMTDVAVKRGRRRRVQPTACASPAEAVVAVNGYPVVLEGDRDSTSMQAEHRVNNHAEHRVNSRVNPSTRWAQFRSLGAAALDLCCVGSGSLDAFIDFAGLAPWDYLGGMLVCQEAGAVVGEANGRPLVLYEELMAGVAERKVLQAAATRELLAAMVAE